MEDRYQGRVQTALEFAYTIDEFDDLVDPGHLYDCCLGPEPSAFVLKKIAREEKSMFNFTFSSIISLFFIRAWLSDFCFVEMATKYSKYKYASVKSLKNEPLSQPTPRLKKCKLDKGKNETPAPLSLFGTPSSPTPSLEMITFTPPTTGSKGKGKAGKSVWEDPATALG